ncbi:10658_t:CDS:2 [Paraglomus brasilianum]|uniref:10658_t:CDS:1 n=1 Tax=Paraglomus brasilianum TaxID=144538 RepID=A0A9N9DRC4_9GLOM|nr:10658_t:CDS:2 [Paraglomus brasilianum]
MPSTTTFLKAFHITLSDVGPTQPLLPNGIPSKIADVLIPRSRRWLFEYIAFEILKLFKDEERWTLARFLDVVLEGSTPSLRLMHIGTVTIVGGSDKQISAIAQPASFDYLSSRAKGFISSLDRLIDLALSLGWGFGLDSANLSNNSSARIESLDPSDLEPEWIYYLPFLNQWEYQHVKLNRGNDTRYQLLYGGTTMVFECSIDDVLDLWAYIRTEQWSTEAQRRVDEFLEYAQQPDGWRRLYNPILPGSPEPDNGDDWPGSRANSDNEDSDEDIHRMALQFIHGSIPPEPTNNDQQRDNEDAQSAVSEASTIANGYPYAPEYQSDDNDRERDAVSSIASDDEDWAVYYPEQLPIDNTYQSPEYNPASPTTHREPDSDSEEDDESEKPTWGPEDPTVGGRPNWKDSILLQGIPSDIPYDEDNWD